MKEYTVTLTSKGQLTLPVSVRRSLGVDQKGSKITLSFNDRTKQTSIRPAMTFEELQAMTSKFVAKNVKPLEDPRALYENRKVKI